MTRTREVSLQTLAVLDQAETDIHRLMGSGQPEQVAAAFGFLLRLLASSSSRLQVGMVKDEFDNSMPFLHRHQLRALDRQAQSLSLGKRLLDPR